MSFLRVKYDIEKGTLTIIEENKKTITPHEGEMVLETKESRKDLEKRLDQNNEGC